MSGLRTALAVLTRVPVGAGPARPGELARAVPWFPLVGGLLGLAVAGIYAGVALGLPPLPAATVAVGAGVVLTGAFHEDGLADAADALGGWRRGEALRIMRDPTHGTYGVLAVVLSVAVRAAALASLDGWAALAVLPAGHALSRAGCIGLLVVARPATGEGLGASYAGAVGRGQVLAALGTGLLVGTVSLGPWVAPAALLAGLGAWAVGRVAARRVGGITGDVLGAAQQVGEVLVLLLGATMAAHGLPAAPWWR